MHKFTAAAAIYFSLWLAAPKPVSAAAPKIYSTTMKSYVDAPINLWQLTTSYKTSAIKSIQIIGTKPVTASPGQRQLTVKVTGKNGTWVQKTLKLTVRPRPNAMPLVPRANMLYLLHSAVPYQVGGPSLLEAPALTAATWGGAVIFSGTDRQNTHFIGHHPGVFEETRLLQLGQRITVTDSQKRAFTYTIDRIAQVDRQGTTRLGENLYPLITETGSKERITLQSSMDAEYKLVVFASLSA